MKPTIVINAALCILILSSCNNRQSAVPSTPAEPSSPWYYFDEDSVRSALDPAAIPFPGFQAWTEARRAASVGFMEGTPVLLVNKLGLIYPDSENGVRLVGDKTMFRERTSGSLHAWNGEVAVRLYRNSFFSSQTTNGTEPFLVTVTEGSLLLRLYPADLGLAPEAQCVALDRVGSMWYAAFKQEKADRIDFTYLEFEYLPEMDKGGTVIRLPTIRRISADTWRTSISPFPVEQADRAIRDLVSLLPDNTALSLQVNRATGSGPVLYTRRGEEPALEGIALQDDGITALLFADGTFYYSQEGRSGVRVLSLPKLSRGYVYGPFILSGNRLIAAWEERRFFETGRAGLLEADLSDVL